MIETVVLGTDPPAIRGISEQVNTDFQDNKHKAQLLN